MSAKSKNIVNDGGPAFPRDSYKDAKTGLIIRQNGMSLRDWFAGQALAGLLQYDGSGLEVGHIPMRVASNCYKLADAMIAAREVKP